MFEIFGIELTTHQFAVLMGILFFILLAILIFGLWKMGKGDLPGLRREDIDQTVADCLRRQETLDRAT